VHRSLQPLNEVKIDKNNEVLLQTIKESLSTVFTGLVQALGQLRLQGPRHLDVLCEESFCQSLAIGDSIAVDGVCLTVETFTAQLFTVTVSPETLRRTTLGALVNTNWPVNLEPALRVGDRLGGHFVSGHVDGLGSIDAIVQTEESWEISLTIPDELAPFIVEKGSIAINGISLTVADCNASGNWFKVAVIPHTYANTNLAQLRSQSLVNLETDMLGKYVAKFMRSSPASARDAITPEFLAEHGFI
jgi:riboflavin synthase